MYFKYSIDKVNLEGIDEFVLLGHYINEEIEIGEYIFASESLEEVKTLYYRITGEQYVSSSTAKEG